MKISSLKTLILAGSLVSLMGTTAAFADMAGYKQLQDSVTNQLNTLGVDTSEVGKLSTTQLAQLTSTLTGKENDETKAMSAQFMITEFLHPTTDSLDTPEGKQLKETLTAKLKGIGIDFPLDKLSATQIQGLNAAVMSRKLDVNKKQSVEAFLAMAMRPSSEITIATNDGAMQMEADIDAKLTSLGLTPPPKGSLTFEQMGKLEGILDTNGTDAEMKTSAAKVLNLN